MKKSKRLEVFQKCNGHCAYCGEKIEYKDMQVDHVKPAQNLRLYKEYTKIFRKTADKMTKEIYERRVVRIRNIIIAEFGSLENVDAIENLLPACWDCNFYKSTFSLEKFRAYMKTLHERMKYKSRLKVALFRKYRVSEGVAWGGVFYFERGNNGNKGKITVL